MKIIYNNIIPFGDFKAVTLWPLIFVQRHAFMSDVCIRHEEIHGRQQREVTAVGIVLALFLYCIGAEWWSLVAVPLYYIIYLLEWAIKLLYCRNAYRSISFEREAYSNQYDIDYLNNRKPFSFIKYF